MAKNGKSTKNRLRVSRVVDVPLREVSGICLRRSRTGGTSLIAIGDISSTRRFLEQQNASETVSADSFDLRIMLGKHRSGELCDIARAQAILAARSTPRFQAWLLRSILLWKETRI
jgi:hypothetical protein